MDSGICYYTYVLSDDDEFTMLVIVFYKLKWAYVCTWKFWNGVGKLRVF